MADKQEHLNCSSKYMNMNTIAFFTVLLLSILTRPTSSETQSLYKDSDPMTQLTNDTIVEQLTGNKKIWIVEFYSSWCGHCQMFAPKWVRLAWELKNWNAYVNVGVINCAAERNLDTCTKFKIEAYPTIRFYYLGWYPPKVKKDENSMGRNYEGNILITDIRRALVDHIENQTDINFVKPNFGFAPNNIISEYKIRLSTYEYLALIFEEASSYTGKLLILDTDECKKIVVRRVNSLNGELASRYKVVIFPALVLVNLRTGESKELSKSNRSHVGFLKALNDTVRIFTEPPRTVEKPKIVDELMLEKVDQKFSDVYMKDLLGAISYSLRHEIPKKEVIMGDALVAMNDWVDLLTKCFPAEADVLKYLVKLNDWIKSKGPTSIQSENYLKFINSDEMRSYSQSDKIQWISCQGSAANYRGFPCGLWQLFHTVTVNCADKTSPLSGLQVLKRIRGFVNHFFGCRYCRDHFMEMSKNVDQEVSSNDESVLWLWRRHNKVNARLKTSVSSDPLFPKIQFPSDSMCEECRKPTTPNNTIVTNPGHDVPETIWNRKIVLEFLKEHYGPDNIRIKLPKLLVDDSDDGTAVRPKFNYIFYSKSASPPSFASIGLSRIDWSMCVFLYTLVVLVVLALYIYFIRRRRKNTWKYFV